MARKAPRLADESVLTIDESDLREILVAAARGYGEAFESAVDRLVNAIQGLANRIEALESAGKPAAPASRVEELEARVKELEEELESVEEDELEQSVAATLAEARRRLAAIEIRA